jgi:hypothetical protein
MFRATMCPSSGETTVFMRDLVLVMDPHRITSTMCRKNTIVSPDDEHIVARNMYRLINIPRINCAPSWLYLQRLYRDAWSTKHKNWLSLFCLLLSASSLLLLSPFVTRCVCPFIPSPCLCSNLFGCIIYFMCLTYSDRRLSEPQSGYVPWKQIRVIALP